ncbi:protein TonB [Silvimonas terrae]|uniref:Protein TonB n=1 Tax=Silvimonas terrae TaxID=300266 RepID=A0A840RCT6_9NEIS|nr:energy transducer TonB [Silvimonas terrae]MBB5190777.1 protein TonB [Silvimonas terrae]
MTNTVYGYGPGRAGGRRATGLVSVVVFHAVLIYALISGLAQDAVKKIQQKVEVSIISEPPPPPPPTPPPKVEKIITRKAPPPPQAKAYVPPVEHPQPAPAPAAIVATTADPAPQAPAPAPAPPAPAPSGPVSAKGNCAHIQPPVYPDKAMDDGIGGAVDITFTTGPDGKLSGTPELTIKGIPASYQRYFRAAVLNALQAYTCNPDLQLKQHIAFNLSDS